MATTMISSIESETATESTANTRNRRIDFHLARKPYTGIGRNSDFQLETLNPSSTTVAIYHKSGSQKPCPNPVSSPPVQKSDDFFENLFDSELNFRFTVRKIGAGLENLGNTCFLNSVLQCLTYTEPLAAYLQSGKHQATCRTAGFCALCAIQKHVSRALQSTGRILAPKDLVSNLRCISRNFRNSRQEDAHEYMVNLLESMHKCCLPKGVPSESHNAYEKSLVHKIFGGRLRSQVKCMQCSFCSDKIDPFLDLSLEISKADSLHKALMHFTAREQLDGGQKQYHCQHCKQKVKALKQLTVDKAPYVLTIHLKRFHATNSFGKINKKVQFELTLNLKPFVSGSYEGDLTYTLYGVLVHVGQNTRSGHYYSFVRTASGFWYSVDDNRVTPVGERIVLEQQAYMLFYYRDRKNVGPKKPVLAIQEENMAAIGVRDKMLSPSNQELKKSVQNGLFEKKYCDVDTPAVKVAVLKHSSITETQLKNESSAHKRNGTMVAGSSEQKKGTDLEPSMNVFAKDLVKPVSIIHPKISTISSLMPCGKGIVENTNIDKAIVASTAVKVNDQKDEESCRKKNSATAQSSKETSQVGSFLKGSITDVAPDLLIESSNSSNILNKHLPIIAPEEKPHKKKKKKVLKCLPSSMHLGANILFGKSIRRKKKHRLSKNLSKLNREQAKDIDMGPSTSERTADKSPALVYDRKRKVKSCSEDGQIGNINKNISKAADDSTMDIVNGEFIERVNLYGEVSTNDKVPLESSKSHLGLAVNKSDAREPNAFKDVNRESMQNGLMSMLTRGLEETIVARWDGIDLPLSRDIESNPHKVVSIGYVPDEWDEEYDRGKRKKVRISQNEFGGTNPFQETASKNARIKKARMDRLISENQP